MYLGKVIMSGNVIIKDPSGQEVVRDFETIAPSTMTTVVTFFGSIHNMDCIFYLLPVLSVSTPATKAGDIKSVRWNNKIRGTDGKFFKNAAFIEMKIDTKDKLVVPKLSKEKIQMCGSKTMDIIAEAATHIVKHINESVKFIRDVERDRSTFLEAAKWLTENCRGAPITTLSRYQILGKDITEQINDNYIVYPSLQSVPPQYIYFVNELMRRCDDIKYLSELNILVEYFSNLKSEWIADKISIRKIGRSMVKYNYNIGFKIDKHKLYVLLNMIASNIPPELSILTKMNMHAEFANLLRSDVEVEIFSNYDNDDKVIRKNKETRSKQTFCVRDSGNIMHSGPGGDAMKECYFVFMNLVRYLRPWISLSN